MKSAWLPLISIQIHITYETRCIWIGTAVPEVGTGLWLDAKTDAVAPASTRVEARSKRRSQEKKKEEKGRSLAAALAAQHVLPDRVERAPNILIVIGHVPALQQLRRLNRRPDLNGTAQ
ncbi:hypothetical protein [Variovorax atrisoli]|uniref:hypothetical protein n=1 Tax=Variovorax atrisoli TaxID=3394203 RepID=UPI00339336F2